MEVVNLNRNLWNKVGNFMLGNGFYIVLTLCVVLIGVSGYYIIGWVTPTPSITVTGTPEITIPQPETPVIPEVQPKTPEPDPDPTPEPTQSDSLQGKVELSPPTEATVAPVVREIVFYYPTVGEVLTPHSVEVLRYHPTMGDWRTHSGIDISAQLGDDVCASAEGVVIDIFSDDLMGITIMIEHPNEVITTYANLAPNPSVIVGEYVSTGQLIAVVGNSAIAEVNSPPHIHFEMSKNGESLNPEDYLKS